MSEKFISAVGRKAKWISWGVHPENGDCLALVRVGDNGCISLTYEATFHGEFDLPFIVEKRADGVERWHNFKTIDSIEWAEPAAPPKPEAGG